MDSLSFIDIIDAWLSDQQSAGQLTQYRKLVLPQNNEDDVVSYTCKHLDESYNISGRDQKVGIIVRTSNSMEFEVVETFYASDPDFFNKLYKSMKEREVKNTAIANGPRSSNGQSGAL